MKIKLSDLKEKVKIYEISVEKNNLGEKVKKKNEICEIWAKIDVLSQNLELPKILEQSKHFDISKSYKITTKISEIQIDGDLIKVDMIKWNDKHLHIVNGPNIVQGFVNFNCIEITQKIENIFNN